MHHYVTAKTVLSAKNGMNLYRGCQHGCIYCDSRSKCYQMNHDFEDIAVKENALSLLEQSLKHKRKLCVIGTGSMSDPYMPLEQELRYTRKALELIAEYGFGATVITKSNRILDDLDLLIKINEQAKCVVQMTLTTFDEALCRKIEPGVCTTKQRFETLKILQEHNIPTVVWFCPILPFINDTEANTNGILDYCIEAKVRGIIYFGQGVTLREGNREYFYGKLDESFPGLKEQYIQKFGDRYEISSPRNSQLSELFYRRCDKAGICRNINEIFQYLNTFEDKHQQQSLF